MLPNKLLYQYIRNNRKQALLVIASGFIHSIITFLLTLAAGGIFAVLFHESGSKDHLLKKIGINFTGVSEYVLFFICCLVCKSISYYFQQQLSLQQGERFAALTREQLFAAQQNWPKERFDQKPFGNYLLRYSNDMKALQSALVKGVFAPVRSLLFLLLGLLLIAGMNVVLGITFFFFLTFSLLLVSHFWKKQKTLVSVSRNQRSLLLAYVTKIFRRFGRTKEENKEAENIERFNEKSAALFSANVKAGNRENIIESFVTLLPFLLIAIFFMMVAPGFINMAHTNAVTVVLILMLMQSPIKSLLKAPGYINKGNISLSKIEAFLS